MEGKWVCSLATRYRKSHPLSHCLYFPKQIKSGNYSLLHRCLPPRTSALVLHPLETIFQIKQFVSKQERTGNGALTNPPADKDNHLGRVLLISVCDLFSMYLRVRQKWRLQLPSQGNRLALYEKPELSRQIVHMKLSSSSETQKMISLAPKCLNNSLHIPTVSKHQVWVDFLSFESKQEKEVRKR